MVPGDGVPGTNADVSSKTREAMIQFTVMPRCFVALAVLLLFPFATQGAALIPTPPALSARAYLLLDAGSARVLVEHRADETLAPASLTKIMTGYVVAGELAAGTAKMDDEVTISVKA